LLAERARIGRTLCGRGKNIQHVTCQGSTMAAAAAAGPGHGQGALGAKPGAGPGTLAAPLAWPQAFLAHGLVAPLPSCCLGMA